MTSRWGRFARGWITALLSVLVAALAHVGGGGAAPGPLAIALGLAFAGMASVALAGRTVSLARLLVAVGFSQLLFHAVFALGGGATVRQAGHHGAVTVALGGAVDHGHEGMLPAHVLAAVITAVLLRFGERAFWSLVALARDGVRRVLSPSSEPAPIDAPRGIRLVAVFAAPSAFDALAGSLGLRGPPRTA